MMTRFERSRHRRSVPLEFLENRSLLSQLIPSGPSAEVRRDHDMVPFKLTLEGTRTATLEQGPPLVVASIKASGEGHATHWGKYTLQESHTLAIDFRPTNPSRPPVASVTGGEAIFTLANGDQVLASYSGDGYLDTSTNQLHLVLTYTITGGTGRYKDAYGNFTLNLTAYDVQLGVPSGLISGTAEGSISSVGSLKGW